MNSTSPAIDFEKQIRNWFSWEDITNYELCNYVISGLLQCNNEYKVNIEAKIIEIAHKLLGK